MPLSLRRGLVFTCYFISMNGLTYAGLVGKGLNPMERLQHHGWLYVIVAICLFLTQQIEIAEPKNEKEPSWVD